MLDKTSKAIQCCFMPPEDAKSEIFLGSEVNSCALHNGFLTLICRCVQVLKGSQENVETPSQVSSQHRSPELCPPGDTGDHPGQILPWRMELEQPTKFFPYLRHSQGFP